MNYNSVPDPIMPCERKAMCVKGVSYWVNHKLGERIFSVLALDLEREEAYTIQLPEPFCSDYTSIENLIEVRGSFAMGLLKLRGVAFRCCFIYIQVMRKMGNYLLPGTKKLFTAILRLES